MKVSKQNVISNHPNISILGFCDHPNFKISGFCDHPNFKISYFSEHSNILTCLTTLTLHCKDY